MHQAPLPAPSPPPSRIHPQHTLSPCAAPRRRLCPFAHAGEPGGEATSPVAWGGGGEWLAGCQPGAGKRSAPSHSHSNHVAGLRRAGRAPHPPWRGAARRCMLPLCSRPGTPMRRARPAGEHARRRPLDRHPYAAEMCPAARRDAQCTRGDGWCERGRRAAVVQGTPLLPLTQLRAHRQYLRHHAHWTAQTRFSCRSSWPHVPAAAGRYPLHQVCASAHFSLPTPPPPAPLHTTCLSCGCTPTRCAADRVWDK